MSSSRHSKISGSANKLIQSLVPASTTPEGLGKPDIPEPASSTSPTPRLQLGSPADGLRLPEQPMSIGAGRGPVGGRRSGPGEVLAVDDVLRDLSGGTLRRHVLIWLAAGQHAHALA